MSTVKAKRTPPHEIQYNFEDPDQMQRQHILGISGKIGSGKTSMCNFLHALAFVNILNITPHAEVNEQGKLTCMDVDGNMKEVDLDDKSPQAIEFLSQRVWPFIRKFSTAEPLKDICVNVLGLSLKSVWGTQEEKGMPTHLRWEDMPTAPQGGMISSKRGYMSGREVMEYVGTGIFRKIHPRCWALALKNNIARSQIPYVVVDDIRHKNEIDPLREIGAKFVRLTGASEEGRANTHSSNCELDECEELFDAVIDTANLKMEEGFGKLMEYLIKWEFFSPINE